MTVRQHRLSTEPSVGAYLSPDDIDHTLNEDWEKGPIGIGDTSGGMNNQDWHLTFAGGEFTITPSDTGAPVVIVTGEEPLDSVQCSFCFDQNGRATIVWIDSNDSGHLYWFDIFEGDFVTFDFQNPVTSVALCLDDKRARQVGINDMLLWYTIPAAGPDHYALYNREQRDRFEDIYPMFDPVWPYIHKLGMNDELRVQITTSTVPPA
jgi:hypothetical protein